MQQLRAAEWINVLAFSVYSVLAWSRGKLDRTRRLRITALGVAGLALTFFAAVILPRFVSPLAASVTRDWIPYLLLLMFYWQGGWFVTRADVAFEARLQRWDATLVIPALEWCSHHTPGKWILSYLEVAYMFCYASMPLGLAALYLLRQGAQAGHFWTVVLLATYPSYGMLPFIPTRPPRALAEKWPVRPSSTGIREWNLWILQHASIHANTFPSGHVATSFACALVLLRFAPLWLGLVFLWIAISIALGAVAGRYHYAADAILAASIAIVVFLAESAIA